MKVRRLKTFTAASMALAAAGVNANDNPFQLVEYGEGVMVAGEAVDMQGNKLTIDQETGFEYGGDQLGKYADGKIGTGAKDPAVCGSFSGSNCSVAHIAPESGAAKAASDAMDKAGEAAGKAVDEAKGMLDR